MTLAGAAFSASQAAYDASAALYDRWAWQEVWRGREFPVVRRQLERAFDKPDVLDLGCGTGAFAAALGGRFGRFAGVDASPGMLEAARGRGLDRAEFIEGDMLDRRLPAGTFDAVVCLRAMSHCEDPAALIDRARSALRPGGLFLLSDVAPEHRYRETRLPTARGKMGAPTFKHAPEKVLRLLQAGRGFRLESAAELKAEPGGDLLGRRSIDPSGVIPFGRVYAARAVDP